MTTERIRWDEKTNKCFLETLTERKGKQLLSVQEVTSEEAAEWEARNKY